MEGMMEGKTFKSGGGSHRTAAELLSDVSVNRIWGYLDYAIENASYLGPSSERPSERHTRESKYDFARAMAEDAKYEAALQEAAAWSSDED